MTYIYIFIYIYIYIYIFPTPNLTEIHTSVADEKGKHDVIRARSLLTQFALIKTENETVIQPISHNVRKAVSYVRHNSRNMVLQGNGLM